MFMNLNDTLLNMRLQYFAEDKGGGSGDTGTEKTDTGTDVDDNQDSSQDDTTDDSKEDPKTFTQAEVDRMIAERAERERKKSYKQGIEAGKSEAEKLAKMGTDEKEQYEHDQMAEELKQLKLEKARSAMVTTANDRLQEADISVPSAMIEKFIVGDDAKDTDARLKDFMTLYSDMKSSIKDDLLRSNRLPKGSSSSTGHTEEDIGTRVAKQNQKQVESPFFKQPNI